MKWASVLVLICAAGCSTFDDPPSFGGNAADTGTLDSGQPHDAAYAEDAADAAGDSGGSDASHDADHDATDADTGDMGSPFDPIAVATPRSCPATAQHISIDSMLSGEFDDGLSLAAVHETDGLELYWIETDGTRRSTTLDVATESGPRYSISVGSFIPESPTLMSLSAFEFIGFDAMATSRSSTSIAYAGHNCNASSNRTDSAWLESTGAESAQIGSCNAMDLSRSFPNAWLPALVGGYNPVDASTRDHSLAFFSQDGVSALQPDGPQSNPIAFEQRPGPSGWSIGTTGDLILFPNAGLSDFFVWNPRTPERAPIEVQMPGISDEIAGGRSNLGFVHYRDDNYFFAFTVGPVIHIVEFEYDVSTHEFSPLRVLDTVDVDRGGAPYIDAVELVAYPGGFSLFYLETDAASGSGRERWTIQPYRLGTNDVDRLDCALVYDDFSDLSVHDVELVVLSPTIDDLIVLAAVNFSFVNGNGQDFINVEGASFSDLP